MSIAAPTADTPAVLNDPKALKFEHKLELMILRVGGKSEWILPEVVNAYMNSYEIVVKPDSRLTLFLTFNSGSNTMFYDDLDGQN